MISHSYLQPEISHKIAVVKLYLFLAGAPKK